MVSMSKRYRPVNWVGWIIAIVAFGLFSTIREDSSVGKWVGYQILGAAGLGMLVRWPLVSAPGLRFHLRTVLCSNLPDIGPVA
jgi:hypothetical protein